MRIEFFKIRRGFKHKCLNRERKIYRSESEYIPGVLPAIQLIAEMAP